MRNGLKTEVQYIIFWAWKANNVDKNSVFFLSNIKQPLSNFVAEISKRPKQPEDEPKNAVAYKKTCSWLTHASLTDIAD